MLSLFRTVSFCHPMEQTSTMLIMNYFFPFIEKRQPQKFLKSCKSIMLKFTIKPYIIFLNKMWQDGWKSEQICRHHYRGSTKRILFLKSASWKMDFCTQIIRVRLSRVKWTHWKQEQIFTVVLWDNSKGIVFYVIFVRSESYYILQP